MKIQRIVEGWPHRGGASLENGLGALQRCVPDPALCRTAAIRYKPTMLCVLAFPFPLGLSPRRPRR